jgi:hypothetical protein
MTFKVFVDHTQWINALGASSSRIVTEDFDKVVLQSGLSQEGGIVDVADQVLQGAGLPSIFRGNSVPVNKLEFYPYITAMGGYWDLSPGGAGIGLELDAQYHSGVQETIGYIQNPYDMNGNLIAYRGFWGFISDLQIQNVIYWSADLTGNSEQFTLADLSFVQDPRIHPVNARLLVSARLRIG